MLRQGNYLWNAGIFLFKASDMINAFNLYCTEMVPQVTAALENGSSDLGFFRLDESAWARCNPISIDYAIMEKADNLVAVPFEKSWNDLGDWGAVWKEMEKDGNGVATSLNAHAIECSDTLLRSENSGQEIVGLGLKNIIAIAMPDAVLVANKKNTQDVRSVVKKLRDKKISQSEVFPKDHRPWGWFERIAISSKFQVKRICVNPGGILSLQSHLHRSEHWVVVEGIAKATINRKTQLVSEGESIFVPLGAIHRLENPGKLPMILIEVQTGSYFGEDDITRHEDVYSRD